MLRRSPGFPVPEERRGFVVWWHGWVNRSWQKVIRVSFLIILEHVLFFCAWCFVLIENMWLM